MNSKAVLFGVGSVLVMVSAMLLLNSIVSVIYNEPNGVVAFLVPALLTGTLGMVMRHKGDDSKTITAKSAYIIITLGWILGTIFGGLPYYMQGFSFNNAMFESISGFSTTGATVLHEANAAGYYIINQTAADGSIANILTTALGMHNATTYMGILFWRDFQQLLGGLGIVVFAMVLLPSMHALANKLFGADSVGPIRDFNVHDATRVARKFWAIYLAFNALCAAMLMFVGMNLFDALCNAFSALSTGGYSPRAASMIYYNNPVMDTIITVFIIVGMANFGLWYAMFYNRDYKAAIRDEEFQFMIGILAVGSLIITFFGNIQGTLAEQFRFGTFQFVSYMGTCGLTNSLFIDNWSAAAKMVLIIGLLIGGCPGSTAGGIKVLRILLDVKALKCELLKLSHPTGTYVVKFNKHTINSAIVRTAMGYTILFLGIWLIMSLLMAISESQDITVDVGTVLASMASCLSNAGPALGPTTYDWSTMNPFTVFLGTIAMFLGRLECLPVFLTIAHFVHRD